MNNIQKTRRVNGTTADQWCNLSVYWSIGEKLLKIVHFLFSIVIRYPVILNTVDFGKIRFCLSQVRKNGIAD